MAEHHTPEQRRSFLKLLTGGFRRCHWRHCRHSRAEVPGPPAGERDRHRRRRAAARRHERRGRSSTNRSGSTSLARPTTAGSRATASSWALAGWSSRPAATSRRTPRCARTSAAASTGTTPPSTSIALVTDRSSTRTASASRDRRRAEWTSSKSSPAEMTSRCAIDAFASPSPTKNHSDESTIALRSFAVGPLPRSRSSRTRPRQREQGARVAGIARSATPASSS